MTLPNGNTVEIATIPFHGTDVLAALIDGKEHIVLRPAIEPFGINYSSQLRKLKAKSWASVVNLTTQLPGDTQTREHATVDMRTFLMLLATINEKQVAPEVVDLLVKFQNEIADVIEAYFTRGGAINARATDGQLDSLADEVEAKRAERKALVARLDLSVIEALGTSVDPTWRESLARHRLAVYNGTAADIEPDNRMLMTQPYLLERGVSKADVGSIASVFGKRVKAAYVEAYGREPEMTLAMVNGREREVKGYYERDRHLFDAVFEQHYSHLAGPQQLELGAA